MFPARAEVEERASPVTDKRPLRVALLGCGVVGTEVARLLTTQRDDLAARVGRPLELVGIAVRRRRHATAATTGVDPALFTTDAEALVDARRRRRRGDRAASSRRAACCCARWSTAPVVVTANKALLAAGRPDALRRGRRGRRRPLLRGRGRRRHPAGPPAARVAGRRPRAPRARHRQRHHQLRAGQDGLRPGPGSPRRSSEAQALGYAEADPTADVEGFDAAAKAAILASLAFHTRVSPARTSTARASPRSPPPTSPAARAWAAWSSCSPSASAPTADGPDDGVSVRVHPAMIPRSHPLAGVRGAYNAVFVEAEAAGRADVLRAAAPVASPTASAVLGDVVAVARHRVVGGRGPGESPLRRPAGAADGPRRRTRYHISLDVADRPGVLAQVATAFADHDVSIETVRQQLLSTDPDESGGDGRASLSWSPTRAPDAALRPRSRPWRRCPPSVASCPSCESRES